MAEERAVALSGRWLGRESKSRTGPSWGTRRHGPDTLNLRSGRGLGGDPLPPCAPAFELLVHVRGQAPEHGRPAAVASDTGERPCLVDVPAGASRSITSARRRTPRAAGRLPRFSPGCSGPRHAVELLRAAAGNAEAGDHLSKTSRCRRVAKASAALRETWLVRDDPMFPATGSTITQARPCT